MNNYVVISDVWYVMNGRDYFIHDWSDDFKELFKSNFKIML